MLTFSILIMTAYIVAIYILFGQLPSISQSYYELSKRYGKPYRYTFSIVLLLYAFPIMLKGLELADGSPFQFLMFLAPAGIMFTASAPQFRESLTDKVHYIGAFIGIACGLLSVAWVFELTLAFILITAHLLYISILLKRVETSLFWIEISAIYSIHAVLLYIVYL